MTTGPHTKYDDRSTDLSSGGVHMQQLTFIEPHKLDWRDAAEPAIAAADDALVRPLVVTTCDLDGPTIRGATPLAMMGPYAFGHEFIAEVVAVGDAVRAVGVGDVVSVSFQICCGECAHCRAGLTGSCQAVPPRSMFGFPHALGGEWGGALSDRVRVPFANHMLLPLPPGV